ncbi:MAG: tyrosine-type recombinase/integrase [Burkholderiales bacterium]
MSGLASTAPSGQSNQTQLGGETRRLLAILAEYVPKVLPCLARGVRVDGKLLERALMAAADLVAPERGFVIQRRILEVIDAGNKSGRFVIPIPWIPVPALPSPPSPFVHADFERMIHFAPVLTIFCDSLARAVPRTAAEQWGRIFFSALHYGGQLQAEWLLAIPAAVAQRHDAELRWLDLYPPPAGIRVGSRGSAADHETSIAPRTMAPDANDEQPIRRWFVDPLTRLLLAGSLQAPIATITPPGRGHGERVMHCIHAYAAAAGFAEQLPSSFTVLTAAARTRLHLHVPPVLVAYMAGTYASASVTARTWERMLRPPQRAVVELAATPPARATTASAADADDFDTEDPPNEEEWVDQFRALVVVIRNSQGPLRKDVAQWRKANSGTLLPSIARVAEWIEVWLLGWRRGHAPLSPKTIYQLLNCAGKRLVGLLGDTDPVDLKDEDAFLELYDAVLEDTPTPGVRNRAATALRSWHDFLRVRYMVPAIDDSSTIFAARGGHLPRVDANLVCVDTFFLAMSVLASIVKKCLPARDPAGAAEVTEILQRVAALGFFGGLRRSEAIGLTIGDLRGTTHGTLTVAPNVLRRLKTRNAYRQIPLHVLMTTDEHAAQLRWRDRRRSSGATDSDPLFPIFWERDRPRPSDYRLKWITEALQRAANDPNLRFHHLRHSFSSLMAIKLWVADQPAGVAALPEWFLPTPHNRSSWNGAERERIALLGTAPSNRRAFLQISRLLGHASIEITLGSYVHVIDLLSGLATSRLAPVLTTETLAALAGYHAKHVERVRRHAAVKLKSTDPTSAQVLDALSARILRERRHPRHISITNPVNPATSPPVQAPESTWPRLTHLAETLCRIEATGANIASIADVSGLPEETLRQIWKRYFALPAAGGCATPASAEHLIHLLARPRLTTQRDLAQKTLDSIERLQQDGQPPQLKAAGAKKKIDQVVADFVDTWVVGTPLTVELGDVGAAKRWLWFIRATAVPCSLEIRHVPSAGKTKPSPTSQLNYWISRLGRGVAADASKKTQPGGTRGTVTIIARPTNPKGRLRKGRGALELAGIRFLLAMLRLDAGT